MSDEPAETTEETRVPQEPGYGQDKIRLAQEVVLVLVRRTPTNPVASE